MNHAAFPFFLYPWFGPIVTRVRYFFYTISSLLFISSLSRKRSPDSLIRAGDKDFSLALLVALWKVAGRYFSSVCARWDWPLSFNFNLLLVGSPIWSLLSSRIKRWRGDDSGSSSGLMFCWEWFWLRGEMGFFWRKLVVQIKLIRFVILLERVVWMGAWCRQSVPV